MLEELMLKGSTATDTWALTRWLHLLNSTSKIHDLARRWENHPAEQATIARIIVEEKLTHLLTYLVAVDPTTYHPHILKSASDYGYAISWTSDADKAYIIAKAALDAGKETDCCTQIINLGIYRGHLQLGTFLVEWVNNQIKTNPVFSHPDWILGILGTYTGQEREIILSNIQGTLSDRALEIIRNGASNELKQKLLTDLHNQPENIGEAQLLYTYLHFHHDKSWDTILRHRRFVRGDATFVLTHEGTNIVEKITNTTSSQVLTGLCEHTWWENDAAHALLINPYTPNGAKTYLLANHIQLLAHPPIHAYVNEYRNESWVVQLWIQRYQKLAEYMNLDETTGIKLLSLDNQPPVLGNFLRIWLENNLKNLNIGDWPINVIKVAGSLHEDVLDEAATALTQHRELWQIIAVIDDETKTINELIHAAKNCL